MPNPIRDNPDKMEILFNSQFVKYFLNVLASTLRKYLTNWLLKSISILSGLSLIGFGIYFGIQAAIVLFS